MFYHCFHIKEEFQSLQYWLRPKVHLAQRSLSKNGHKQQYEAVRTGQTYMKLPPLIYTLTPTIFSLVNFLSLVRFVAFHSRFSFSILALALNKPKPFSLTSFSSKKIHHLILSRKKHLLLLGLTVLLKSLICYFLVLVL